MTLLVTAFVVLGSLVAGGVTLLRPPRRAAQAAFALGMAAFCVEAAVVAGLLHLAETATEQLWWLAAHRAVGLLLPVPWCAFAFLSARHHDARVPVGWRLAFSVGTLALVGAAVAALVSPLYVVPVMGGGFTRAPLAPLGQAMLVVELLATIAVLYGLEPSIRNSYGSVRWRVKYLTLGLVGIFAVRFYLLSQTLLIPTLRADHLRIGLMTLAGGLVFLGIGLARTGGLGTDLAVSRHFVYRSIAGAVAGGYLILAGAAGWLANALGIPDKAVWGTLALFVSVMVLAALLLSEQLRWHVKRYVSTHFYAQKYDYREQWRSFTARLGTRVTLDGLIAELLRSVMDTVGTTRAVLYLGGRETGSHHVAQAIGLGPLPPAIEFRWEEFLDPGQAIAAMPVASLGNGRAQTLLDAGLAVAVALPSQGRLLGVMLVGPERTDVPYSEEDLRLLTTLGEQAASAIATVQLSEQLAQARAFEAFSRLTSFVVHDLKNSIAALSLLSQNATQHMDNPEFQRDAVRTVVRTVERMQRLLRRLSTRQPAEDLLFDRVDLCGLARDTAQPLLTGGRIRLVFEGADAAPVRADADAIQRVLQNLVTNAVEAMDGEGQITIRCDARDGLVTCAVTDTGCGMSGDFVRRSLFVPFQTTKKGGWGVGLYQARETMLAHSGRIEVDSREGHGTTITLVFPDAAA